MKKIFYVILILLLFVAGSFLYLKEGSLPVDKSNKTTKIFVVSPGEKIPTIAKNLENEGLIRSKITFYWIVKQSGIDNKIQAGDFRLSPSMNARDIAHKLTQGTLDQWTTVIEGLRKEQIGAQLSKEFDISEIEFVKKAKEGYVFPDTYLIPKDATVDAILSIFYKNFDKKFDDTLKRKATARGLSVNGTVILASIVEKEARTKEDKQQVANILLRRLNDSYPLQVDVTIAYALGYDVNEKKWWRTNITGDDLNIASPFNLHKTAGLPPTPICSPGLDSITAIVNADPTTPYYFYFADKTGKVRYSKTLEEHNTQIAKYGLVQ